MRRKRAYGGSGENERLGGGRHLCRQLDALLSRMLSNALRDHVEADELPLAVEAFRATVEGTFVKGLDGPARRELLTFALERLMSDQAGA